jgi:predicted glycosyltransferase
MKIWIDFDNTPHVNVLLPLIKRLQENHEIIMTARDVFETVPLLHENNVYPMVIGNHKGKSRIRKVWGLIQRTLTLVFKVPKYDVSFSLGGNTTATISKLRRNKSIVFSDNDISFKAPAYKFADYFIFPTYFDTSVIEKKYNIKREKIFKFNGFKEDIYISDFKPDPNFLDNLPFKDFITIRPENLKASYVPLDSKTIVMDLFNKFQGYNILFLPRYLEERSYADGFDNIFIPEKPLSGLDVCYYTRAMLTGAGTFAREAAILGKPAVSFFPGKIFLSVDEYMISKKWIFKSRDVDAIYDFVIQSKDTDADLERSTRVQTEVLDIFSKILNET